MQNFYIHSTLFTLLLDGWSTWPSILWLFYKLWPTGIPLVMDLGVIVLIVKNKAFDRQIAPIFLSMVFLRDLFFLSLMTCNSIYMVNILYRHHKTAQNVHSAIQPSSCSLENKATYVILILVSCFVFFSGPTPFLVFIYFIQVRRSSNWRNLVTFFHHVTQPSVLSF